MDRVKLEKGKSPKLTYVIVGPLELAFSYETIVAFRHPNDGWIKSENIWSQTTSRHLNEIPGREVKNDEFDRRLENFLNDLRVYLPEPI